MRTFITIFFFSVSSFLTLLFYTPYSWAMMQSPSDQSVYQYTETPTPIVSPEPSRARPIGVGGLSACGNILTLRVALDMISDSVDLFLAISIPVPGAPLYMINSDHGLQPISEGLVPWKTKTAGPIEESIFTSIDTSEFPKGVYNLFLLATSSGSIDNYYLWITSFQVSLPSATSGPVTKNIGPDGGVIQSPDRKARLEIPAGALSSNTSITMKPISVPEHPDFLPGSGWKLLPDGLKFDRPVRLILCYDPFDLPVDRQGRLVLYKSEAEEWTGVPGSEEIVEGNAVIASLNSFSEYGLRLVPLAPDTLWIKEARPSSDTIYSYAEISACDSVPFPGSYQGNAADPPAGFYSWGEPDDCGFITGGSTLGEYTEFKADASSKPLVAKMSSYTIFTGVGDLFQIGFDGNTKTKPLEDPPDNDACSYAKVSHGLIRANTMLLISNPAAKKFDIVLSWSVSGTAAPSTEYAYYIFDFFYQATKCGGITLSKEWIMPAYSEEHGSIRVKDGKRRIRINRLKEVQLYLSLYANANSHSGDDPASQSSIQGWMKVEVLPVFNRR